MIDLGPGAPLQQLHALPTHIFSAPPSPCPPASPLSAQVLEPRFSNFMALRINTFRQPNVFAEYAGVWDEVTYLESRKEQLPNWDFLGEYVGGGGDFLGVWG